MHYIEIDRFGSLGTSLLGSQLMVWGVSIGFRKEKSPLRRGQIVIRLGSLLASLLTSLLGSLLTSLLGSLLTSLLGSLLTSFLDQSLMSLMIRNREIPITDQSAQS